MRPRIVHPDQLHGFRLSEHDHCRLALLSAPSDADRRDDPVPTASPLTIFLEIHDPSDRVPFHSHHHAAELFFVLRGQALFHVGERTIEACGGDFVVVPEEALHDLQNPGPGRLYLLTVLSRDAGFASMLEGGIPSPLDAEDLAVLRSL
jgi:mannose-6-phosphate isomerase-like protein (cupin superfamily)